ncbi:MAG: DEAD/DEAH box helicase [Puniceicoccaceae bacterium]|nr:MAG: DEAD/DEAH box helicase [Puniceicoccaceae bacterium]
MEKRPFSELGISDAILKAVDRLGFEEASPIQTAVIPVALQGGDVVGQSSTGSGKTAAFAIPAIERLDPARRVTQVLILCPTRELALQVAEETGKLAAFRRGVQVVPIYGGQSYDRQFRALAAGAQMVIGTPGRILDHLDRGTLVLDDLAMLILDEADRMLDMGFREDIERVLAAAPEGRQLFFFSATLPRPIRDLISRFAKNPSWIHIEAKALNAPQVDQVYYEVDRRSKLEILTRLIDLNDFRYGIIFCSTKVMVDDLDEHLHARGYATDRLHGDISQAQRNRVMAKFRKKGFEFLVATDVAARGLDVDDLEVVFNYDLPNDSEDYTHRIGRTGRAGRKGRAITFVSGREVYSLQAMIRHGGLKLRREKVPSLDQVEQARENAFFERVRAILDSRSFKANDRFIDRLLDQGYPSTDIASALIHLIQNGGLGQDAAEPEPGKAFFQPDPPAPETGTGSREAGPRPDSGKKKKASPEARRPRDPGDPVAKPAHQRPGRTGREKGYVTLCFNVGKRHGVRPADLVGKIAGVTRLPPVVVGAIDLHDRQSLVDVAAEQAGLIERKLAGVRVKGQVLKPFPAAPDPS